MIFLKDFVLCVNDSIGLIALVFMGAIFMKQLFVL